MPIGESYVQFPDRKFGRLILAHYGWYPRKALAEKYAKSLKDRHYRARVVKHLGGYSVYSDR